MRRWTAGALAGQKQIAARLSREGIQLVPDFVYTRTFNGFAAPIDGRALALLERDPDVVGVYPVRAAYPGLALRGGASGAAVRGRQRPARRSAVCPASTARGDDRAARHRRRRDASVHPRPAARRHRRARPRRARRSRARTRTSRRGSSATGRRSPGLLVGSGGPGGIRGVAPGRLDPADPHRRLAAERRGRVRRLRPDRPAARRPRAGRRPGRGRRRARRRARRGHRRHRAVRRASRTGRSRARSPARHGWTRSSSSRRGTRARPGPSYGSIGGPGGAPAALTVGAADLRRETATVRVVVRAGLRVAARPGAAARRRRGAARAALAGR